MNLSDVLKQIAPCDTQKPYIFISYSNADSELVWNDALEFQRMGYNIWLDEKNLDKTQASWKDDALRAIEDMYCMLVVFYVSKRSLISEACYNELSKTRDELTVALHYGPVKFIAIDVDEVGNIGDFTRKLHQSIFENKEFSKDDKSKMLLTLHHFMKDFFDSNNEKVRIHPKNEPNRKMNYYEDIIAAFPDSAKNQPPRPVVEAEEKKVIPEPEPKPAPKPEPTKKAPVKKEEPKEEAPVKKEEPEEEAPVTPENSPSIQNELELLLKMEMESHSNTENKAVAEVVSEEPVPENVETPSNAPSNAESISSPVSDSKPDDKKEDDAPAMTDEYLLEIEKMIQAELGAKTEEPKKEKKAKKEAPKTPAPAKTPTPKVFTKADVRKAVTYANAEGKSATKFEFPTDANERKIKKAIASYAKEVAYEDVIAFFDSTLFGSAKDGYLVTKQGLYGKDFRGDFIDFNDLKTYVGGTETYYLTVAYNSGKTKTLFIPTVYQSTIKCLLQSLLDQRS